MKIMQLPVTLYRDEDDWYIQEAIQLCLDVRRAQGLPLTIESRQIEAPIYA